MQQAISLLNSGRTVEAEELVLQAATKCEAELGANDPQTAAAYCDLGNILTLVGNQHGAVDAFRRACTGPMPTETQARRDRLSYLMNLGIALRDTNQFDEAEKVFQQGLTGRIEFYGKDHPGYAFGLEPYAELMMKSKRVTDAYRMFNECVGIYLRNAHPQIAQAIALRAETLKLMGFLDYAFGDCHNLPDEILDAISQAIGRRSNEVHPGILSKIYQDLLKLFTVRFGSDSQRTINCLIGIVNSEQRLGKQGNLQIRLDAAQQIADIYRKQRRDNDLVIALQGLALIYSDADRNKDAIKAYQNALKHVKRDIATQASIRRNLGSSLAATWPTHRSGHYKEPVFVQLAPQVHYAANGLPSTASVVDSVKTISW
jgi:tetratricopeptide (TPR) repeat protein